MKIKSYKSGNIYFRNGDGKYHRKDGPAVVYEDKTQEWHLNGKLHREDGPAIFGLNGYQAWFYNGKRHRTDGPAIIRANGSKVWYLNDKRMSESKHARMVAKLKEKA